MQARRLRSQLAAPSIGTGRLSTLLKMQAGRRRSQLMEILTMFEPQEKMPARRRRSQLNALCILVLVLGPGTGAPVAQETDQRGGDRF